ncbi:hypothetical protein [Moheibacter sp.]|uniref:hypothetical protein n=1 Tax=Moheibacter sp. TaxID=1965316 RepID=UPI003C71CFB3
MNSKIIQNNKRLKAILLCALGLLFIPLIAMQFTKEVNWAFSDFLMMGFLLSGTGLIIELILRKFKTKRQRIILCIVAVFVFVLIWGEKAVGIFNSPVAGS